METHGTDDGGVVHLVDDTALGGVMNVVSVLTTMMPDAGPQAVAKVFPLQPNTARNLDASTIVVHFTMSWKKLPYLLSLALLNRKARIVLVEHTYTAAFEAIQVPNLRRFRSMLRTSYRVADDVVAVSSAQAAWMGAAGLLPGRDPRILPCVPVPSVFLGIDLPRPHEGPVRLGAFGRYHPQKGFDVLLDAMSLLRDCDVVLTLAGYGELEETLRGKASAMSNVTMTGRVRAADFLSEMDAIAMPSMWEAGGVACWEARFAGRPIVVSDADCLPGQCGPSWGRVARAGDVRTLADAVAELAASDVAAMGAASRASTGGAFEAMLSGWRSLLTGK